MAPSSPPTHDIIPQKSRPQNRSFPESLISLLPAVTYVDPTAPLLNLEVCAAVFGHVSGFVHRADGHAIRSGCQRRHRQLHSQRHNWIAGPDGWIHVVKAGVDFLRAGFAIADLDLQDELRRLLGQQERIVNLDVDDRSVGSLETV